MRIVIYGIVGLAGEGAAVTWGHGSRGSPDRASHSSGREAEEVEAQLEGGRRLVVVVDVVRVEVGGDVVIGVDPSGRRFVG